MPSKENKLTVKDIARMAGVGTTAVSRFFSGKGYLSEKLRKRIEKVVLKTGYRPNRAARHLKSGEHHEFGIYLPRYLRENSFLFHSFLAFKLLNLIQSSIDSGFNITIFSPRANDLETFQRELLLNDFKGIFILDPISADEFAIVKRLKIPYVFSNFNCFTESNEIDDLQARNAVLTDYASILDHVWQLAKEHKCQQVILLNFEKATADYQEIIERNQAKFKIPLLGDTRQQAMPELTDRFFHSKARVFLGSYSAEQVLDIYDSLKSESDLLEGKFILSFEESYTLNHLSPPVYCVVQRVSELAAKAVKLMLELLNEDAAAGNEEGKVIRVKPVVEMSSRKLISADLSKLFR